MRHSRAPFDHLGARENRGAHRESSGGERGVREDLEGAGRRRQQWLEREHGAGEGESDQNMTKNKRWRYLRARVSTADPRDSSATGLVLGEGEFAGGGCEWARARPGTGENGARLGFIDGRLWRRRKGRRGAGRIRSPAL